MYLQTFHQPFTQSPEKDVSFHHREQHHLYPPQLKQGSWLHSSNRNKTILNEDKNLHCWYYYWTATTVPKINIYQSLLAWSRRTIWFLHVLLFPLLLGMEGKQNLKTVHWQDKKKQDATILLMQFSLLGQTGSWLWKMMSSCACLTVIKAVWNSFFLQATATHNSRCKTVRQIMCYYIRQLKLKWICPSASVKVAYKLLFSEVTEFFSLFVFFFSSFPPKWDTVY